MKEIAFWYGEFGWELCFWQGYLRNLSEKCEISVMSYPGRELLYQDFAKEFFPLPDWFLKNDLVRDCWKLNNQEDLEEKLLKEVTNRFASQDYSLIKPDISHHIWRNGYGNLDQNMDEQKFIRFGEQLSWDKKEYIAVFPRKRRLIGEERNWGSWQELIFRLQDAFDFKVVVIGTDESEDLKADIVVKSKSISEQVEYLEKSFLAVGSLSGGMFLPLLSGTISVIFGADKNWHHVLYRNYLNTPCLYVGKEEESQITIEDVMKGVDKCIKYL